VRILIAEDDPVSRRVLQVALTKLGYQVETACDGEAAWQALQRDDTPRLAVLDWMMPGINGPEVCRRLRRLDGRPYVYTLLLTARGQKEDLVRGLEAGADDYLVKPFDAVELKARLNVGRRILGLQNELLAACAALQERASRDALTDLWNHGAILDILQREYTRARREGLPFALAMADLDHFKRVNDSHGHPAGDAVLRETARRIRASLRRYDAVGRYGGEEFLIVVPGLGRPAGLDLAERLRLSVAERPVAFEGRPIPVSVSVGLTVAGPHDGVDPAALLQAADAALYRAKHAGRNRVQYADPVSAAAAAPTA